MRSNIHKIAACGIGAALYVALSMVLKLPIAGNASLDLGYVVFAVYCYWFGSVVGAAVGGIGCTVVSLLSSGSFAPGWLLGNVLAGLLAGRIGHGRQMPVVARAGLVFLATCVCVFACKCAVECPMYGIPFIAKAPRTLVVAAIDGACMAAGTILAAKLPVSDRLVHRASADA